MKNKKTGYPSIDKPWLKYTEYKKIPDINMADTTLYQYIYEQNKDNTEGAAISYFDHTINFKTLFACIDQTANALEASGVKRGDIVTFCTPTTPEVIYLFYALDKIGATANMTDPRTSIEGLRRYISEVHSKFVVCIEQVYSSILAATEGTDTVEILTLSPVASLPFFKRAAFRLKNKKVPLGNSSVQWPEFFARGKNGKNITPEYDPEHAALIVHTGGTTGLPKGVLLGDRAINALAMQYFDLELNSTSKFLNIMPPFIAYGICVGVHMPLSWGTQTVVIPMFDAKNFADLLLKYKPTTMAGVPSHYQVLMNDPKMANADLSFFTGAGAGGDAINVGAEEKVNDFLLSHGAPYKLAKGYGMTECSSSVAANFGNNNKLGSVGYPYYYSTISVFKEGTDEELKYNELGEICISGPNLMIGYYNNQSETASVLKKHSDGEIWLHTGDVGKMDEDGFLYIVSRIKRVIIRHDGFKVFPILIENCIGMHPDVELCSAVRTADNNHAQGDLPIVHVVLKDDCTRSETAIKRELATLCLNELPEYAQPVDFIFRDKMPYTNIGKIDYRALENETNSSAL